MNKNQKASISLFKVFIMIAIVVAVMSAGVVAANTKLENVKIILSNGYEMTVFTTKDKVSEILAENHIILLPDEKVTPDENSELSDNKTIRIAKDTEEDVEVAQKEEVVSSEDIIDSYNNIVEKIVVVEEVIPFETITKDASEGSSTTKNKVVQEGQDGIRQVKYRVRYQNDEEIEKTEISSEVVKEPVNKIVEVAKKTVTARSSSGADLSRLSAALMNKVEGMTPVVKGFNASAYCPCAVCCGSSTGKTASGDYATAWYTLAAGSGYPIGTVIYIPYFSNMPNGGWFVVQDRGGAISNNRIDVFMDTHSQALQFGRKYLECYVYEF